MNLVTKISFFFGRTSSIVSTVATEGVAVLYPAKFAECKKETINYKVFIYWYGENRNHFLTQQLHCLKKRTSCPVKMDSAAKIGEKMVVILFLKGNQTFSESIPTSLPQMLIVMISGSDNLASRICRLEVTMSPFEFVFPTNRIVHFVEISLFI